MTHSELEILLQEDVQAAIALNIDRDPLKIALDGKIPHAREVATQVKYLQRARRKLPRLFQAQGIIPSRAFEQSSSEECASAKRIAGGSLLDLTCGLGIDSASLAANFERVVALERDPVLAAITSENMRRMGINNVEVKNISAEEYLDACDEQFDWVYADPDRRDEQGRRLVRLEDCSPNMVALLPKIRKVSRRLAIKNSPLFDIDEAWRIFPDAGVEVISLHDECKEVMIYSPAEEPYIAAEAVGRGRYEALRNEVESKPEMGAFEPEMGAFEPESYHYLVIPDVALQKARLVSDALRGKAKVWSNLSFGFAEQMPEGVVGRVEAIERIEEFDPKRLKRELKGVGVDIILRDFALGVDEIRKRCSMRSGSQKRIALTRIAGKSYTIYLK